MRRKLFWPTLVGIAAVGCALRVGARLYTGDRDFWKYGYGFFFDLARGLAEGKGLTLDGVHPTAFRVPLYPAFLAAVTWGRQSFLPVVVVQALVGSATVVCAALLAAEMWDADAAVWAAALTAIYPYYVIHDTALQETGLFTLLTLLSVILLRRAARDSSGVLAACAGVALGADVMTRATIAPFAVFAPLWLVWTGTKANLRIGLLCAAALALTISPWLVRSYRLTGVPGLSTETGLELWNGNNPLSFSHYPRESSDLSKAAALDALTPAEHGEIGQGGDNEAAVDRWFWRRGMAYIRNHPCLTISNGFRKIAAAFGWLPSPRRSFWPNLVHAFSYGPVMLLGLLGMWTRRDHWREDLIFYVGFVSFLAVTAVFFGHTSHRSYLDVYLIVFAAGSLENLRRRYFVLSRVTRAGA